MPDLAALHVVASINARTGGPAASVTGLASALARSGVRTFLVSLDYIEHGALLDAPGVTSVALPPSLLGKRMRGFSPALARAIANRAAEGIDIIHHHGLWMLPGIYARRVAVRHDVPLMISPRGMLDPWSLERRAATKALAALAYERRNLESARAFHATSAMEADAIRRRGLAQPIAVIPNGVDLPALRAKPSREGIEQRFGELRGRHWLVFMGRLHAKKGIDMLLDAWTALESSFPDWHLVLAGPDLDGYGARLAGGLERKSSSVLRATWVGMVEGTAKQSLLENCDVFVLPTRSENFGITVAEALACGVPVVTTTAAPWSELATRGCGWSVAPETAAIVDALRTALSLTRAERKAMGKRGRRYAEEAFSWDSIGARMADVYRWLALGGAPPSCVRQT